MSENLCGWEMMIASGGGAAVTATTASNQSLQFDLPEFFKKWRKKPPSQFRQFRQILDE